MDLLTWLALGSILLLLGLTTGAWSTAPWVPTKQGDWPIIAKLLDYSPINYFMKLVVVMVIF